MLVEYKEALEQCENKATNIQQKHEEYPEFSELNLHSLEVMQRNEELTQGKQFFLSLIYIVLYTLTNVH